MSCLKSTTYWVFLFHILHVKYGIKRPNSLSFFFIILALEVAKRWVVIESSHFFVECYGSGKVISHVPIHLRIERFRFFVHHRYQTKIQRCWSAQLAVRESSLSTHRSALKSHIRLPI